MLVEHAVLTAFALGLLGNVITDQELFHNNIHKALDTNGVTVILDHTTAADSVKFLKFAIKGGIPFTFVNVDNTFAHMNLCDFAKQIIVLCSYTNMEFLIRNFTVKKMMVPPHIWVFVTEEDLSPIFTDSNLGSVLAISKKNNKVTLYSKGCRGLNVTKFPEVALETLSSFEDMLRYLNPLLGCTLSVVVLDHRPLAVYNGEKSLGYDVDTLKVFAEATGQKLLFSKSKDNIFGQLTVNGWNGNLGVLERDEQDMALPFFMLTKERSKYFASSGSVHISQWVGLVKAKPIFSATGLFKPFSLEVWMIIASATVGVAICYTFSSRVHLYFWRQRSNAGYLYMDKCFHVWTGFLQQESRPQGDWASGRILLFTISTTSLIILTAYSSILFAVLSSTQLDIPFKSMEGLLENGQFRPVWESTPATMGVGNESKLKSFREVSQRFLTPVCGSSCLHGNHHGAMDYVNRNDKVVYFLIKDAALSVINDNCKYAIAIDNIAVATFHIYWRKGFVHSRYVDPYIAKIREIGIISRIYKRTNKPNKNCFLSEMELGIEIMYLPFVIYGFGIIVSFIFLKSEIFLHQNNN